MHRTETVDATTRLFSYYTWNAFNCYSNRLVASEWNNQKNIKLYNLFKYFISQKFGFLWLLIFVLILARWWDQSTINDATENEYNDPNFVQTSSI